MPHLNQLVEKYGKKGFEIVGVTKEPKAPTEKFVEDTGYKAHVVLEKSNATFGKYGFKGYPSSALVGPKGDVLWTGHPAGLTEDIIEQNLSGVVLKDPRGDGLYLDLELPSAYASIARKLSKGRIGDGYEDLKAAETKASQDEQAALADAIGRVDKLAEQELAAAARAVEEGRYYDAQEIWNRVKKHLRGHESAEKATAELKDLKANKDLKHEVEAGKRIAKALDLIDKGQSKKAVSTLRSVTSGYLKTTKEAQRAATILEGIKD